MHALALVLALVGGVLVGLLAPNDDTALAACLRECGETSSGTDEETCRLQCRQRSESTMKTWKRTELKGGSPDPNVERGSTTTTVETGPQGTTTTITKSDGEGRATVERVEGAVPVATAKRLQAWCWVGCSTRRSIGARTSCRATCPRVTEVVVKEPEAARKPDPATCSSACSSKARSCHAACPSRNADRATCTLQCNEAETACRKRC
jgi:hypothetical protein